MAMPEWGGSLPIETLIRPREDYRGLAVLPVNSGRVAVYAACLDMGINEVWLPYYLCPTVRDFLQSQGVLVHEYHIDDDYLPLVDSIADSAGLVWTNWFGAMGSERKRAVAEAFGRQLIIDNCHAFFEEPMLGVHNVYSCRKFLGVPQGAFLVAESFDAGFQEWEPVIDPSYEYLQIAAKEGSDKAYPLYLAHEEDLTFQCGKMDPLVQAAIGGIDLEAVKAIRSNNLQVLREQLAQYELSSIDKVAPYPVWFPLYVEDDNLRDRLIESRIFVPRLWKRILSMEDATPRERTLAKYLLPLPIDQRYRAKDMRALAQKVRDLIGWRS